jgi:hypothetical protein
LGTRLPTDLPDSDSHLPRATLYRLETSFFVATTPSNVAGRQLAGQRLQHNRSLTSGHI